MHKINNKDFSKFIDFLYTIENDLCDKLNKKIMEQNYSNTLHNNQTIPVHNSQTPSKTNNNFTKSNATNCKLFNFLPTYTSSRPFISHQNRWEQVDDINKQYINKIISAHNANTSRQKQNDCDEFDKIINDIRKGNDNAIPPQHQSPPHDNSRREWVNSPQHYNPGTYETWRIINEYDLDKDFYLATALRYILRAGKKYNNKFAEDLRKAIWYLNKRADMWEQDNEL